MQNNEKIVELLKSIRKQHHKTQSEMAQLIDLSQSRYSEVEKGKGQLSAEQLLIIMRMFGVSFDYFNNDDKNKSSQNLKLALKNWGATHLEVMNNSVIHSNLYDLYGTIIEVLVGFPEPELICALCPIIVNHRNYLNFDSMGMKLYDLGIDGRLWWLVEATLWAIRDRMKWMIPKEFKELYQETEEILTMKSKSSNAFFSLRKAYPTDILDPHIKTSRILEKVRIQRDTLATRWRMITRIKIADFVKTLEEWEKNFKPWLSSV